jgi:hypothetical protein
MASTPRTPGETTSIFSILIMNLIKSPAAVEGMDQWFDSFQQFEATLEGMARASMDVKFKDELTAIEQCNYSLDHDYSLSLIPLCASRVQSAFRI